MSKRIQGTIIDEIKNLPKTELHRFIIERAETQLNKGEITSDNALEMCSRAILDYHTNKKQIVSDLNNNHKITIIDSIMGSGKSTFLIQQVINKNPNKKFIVVLPYIDEIKRYEQEISAYCHTPFIHTDKGTKEFVNKTQSLQKLIAEGKSPILATHQLIYHINQTTIDLLKKSDYELIIDECLQCVDIYKRKGFYKDDLRTLIKTKDIVVNEDGFLIWQNKNDKYKSRYNDIKQLSELHSLMYLPKKNGGYSDNVLIWHFPIVFFSLFSKTYIATYLWNGSMQKSYFDMNDVDYLHMTISGKIPNQHLDIYSSYKEIAKRKKYFELINLYGNKIDGKGKLNNIGTPDRKNKRPLSVNWYEKSKKSDGRLNLKLLKSNTESYFKNFAKTKSEDNMWTTFKDYRTSIQGKGYTGKRKADKENSYKQCYVSCNAKGTNDFKHKKSLAYLINKYVNPSYKQFFESHGATIDEDLYALSELLQWIWRSQIREGKPINLYLPSMRMRELLGKWALGKI